ncbi:MAG: hypothetical protein ACXADY_18335 [Candidatus Hodarchaeales archaeon]|jgi:hypothetical protein
MKAWYQSKIVWLNVITTLVLSAEALMGLELIPPAVAVYVLGGVTVLNVILRVWFTDTSIRH